MAAVLRVWQCLPVSAVRTPKLAITAPIFRVKAKAKLQSSVYDMKAYGGAEVYHQSFLISALDGVISFTVWPFYFRYPLHGRLGWPEPGLAVFVEEKNLSPLLEI
jgi:hypothetical protein